MKKQIVIYGATMKQLTIKVAKKMYKKSKFKINLLPKINEKTKDTGLSGESVFIKNDKNKDKPIICFLLFRIVKSEAPIIKNAAAQR